MIERMSCLSGRARRTGDGERSWPRGKKRLRAARASGGEVENLVEVAAKVYARSHCHSNDLYARLKLGRPHLALFSLPSSPDPPLHATPEKRAQPPVCVHVLKRDGEAGAIVEKRGEKGRGKKFGSPRGERERRGGCRGGKSPEHMQIRERAQMRRVTCARVDVHAGIIPTGFFAGL